MLQTSYILVSIAGGEKYSSSSMVSLFYTLGRIIGTFCFFFGFIFALSWSRCPIHVAREGGKNLRTFFTFILGHVIKFPFKIARIKVLGDGLK